MTHEGEFRVPLEFLLEVIIPLKEKRIHTNEKWLEDTLARLLLAARGKGEMKEYIGKELGPELVQFTAHKSKEICQLAAKLLRSITVQPENKPRINKYSSTLVSNLINAPPKTKVPLTAVLWNLSSLSSNRESMLKAGAVNLLVDLLEGHPTEVQVEATGALRNFTLDEDLFPALLSTPLIDKMLCILHKCENIEETNNKLLWNILDSFENLANHIDSHDRFLSRKAVSTFLRILKDSDQDTFQKFILSILLNISNINEKGKEKLCKYKATDTLLEVLEKLKDDGTINVCQDLLMHLAEADSDIKEKIRLCKLKNPSLQKYADEVKELLTETVGCGPIQESDINYMSELGEGSFGAVVLADYLNCPVAIKFLKYDLNEKNVEKVVEELKIMKKLKHPNIVMLMGATVNSKNEIMLITEYAKRGDLKTCLAEITSVARRMKVAKELARGLCWCHHHKIIHRDLKLENIFVTDNWGVKLGDFGLAICDAKGAGWHNFRGNVKYSAPELLRERALRDQGDLRVFPYSEKSDMYSFGLLWYEILTRLSPFKDKPAEYKGREGQAKYTLEGHRPVPPACWPQTLRTIMCSTWANEPGSRPTFTEILKKWDYLTEKLLCPKDLVARKLIKSLWKDQSKTISYDDFHKAFLRHCTKSKTIANKDNLLLQELCRESVTFPFVSFENFCHVAAWFGPLDLDGDCSKFFTRMKELKSRGFFRGHESHAQSDSNLKLAFETNVDDQTSKSDAAGKSYFIMKFSFDSMGEFELRWINSEGKIMQQPIPNDNGSLIINGLQLDKWGTFRSFVKKNLKLSPIPQ